MTDMTATTPLTAADRCDRCGAQAYVKATLPAGSALLFCAHHMREHGDKIVAIPGVTLQDEREVLTARS
jgi:hypothetical protein